MLSDEEKKEMLEDANNLKRREDFRFSRNYPDQQGSLQEYLLFLESVQKAFGPFPISTTPTNTRHNKL